MTNDQGGNPGRRNHDLEERTACFGERVVQFAKLVPVNPVTMPLISQLVRCGTSIGANYCEADEAESRKEFRYRISVCKRESKETKHQVRMIVAAEPELKDKARPIWQEAKELTLIFAAILRSHKGD
jgi:four helix bundle protein